MTTLTQAQFARHLDVDRAYVTRLKQAGRLVLTSTGQVDVEASEARIAATADPAKAPVAERHAAGRAAAVDGQKPAKTTPESEGDPADGTPDYQKARARREEANANLAEIELAERAKQLFRADEVLEVIADAATTFRVSLDARRAMLVSQLTVMTDERAVREFLEDQDEALLADLSARFSDIGKRQ